MKKFFTHFVFAVAVMGLGLSSCGNPAKMAKEAELYQLLECNPEILEVVDGKICAELTFNFPEKFFNKKAIVELTPVIVYEGGESVASSIMFQGEDVTNNYTVIPKEGAQETEVATFEYVKGMEKSRLEVRLTVHHKDKKYFGAPAYNVADGANTTYMLVYKNAALPLAPNTYQYIIDETAETQIDYHMSSATVRPSQLSKDDVKAFQDFLSTIKDDERRTIMNTDVIAYASPDGQESFNTSLSETRGKTAMKAFKRINNKKVGVDTELVLTTISEDWEGFRQLVMNSEIEDKELIIRVLEMYEDVNVREREIKNMSHVYTTLAEDILPRLRRARFVTNIEYRNYSDEELVAMVENNMDALDNEALLKAATLIKDNDTKLAIYAKAVEKFACSRALVNSAITLLQMNKAEEAMKVLAKVQYKSDCYYNTLGVANVNLGNYAEAMKAFEMSTLEDTKYNVAVVNILTGEYEAAYGILAGSKKVNEALAAILVGKLDAAKSILGDACKCPYTSYLRAIVAAREGRVEDAKAALEVASKMKCLAERALTDIEFASIR